MTAEFIDPCNATSAADVGEIMRLIVEGGARYWQRQSGMASVRCVDGPNAGSSLAIVVQPGVGVLLCYTPYHGEDEYLLVCSQGEDVRGATAIYPGGNEWEVPLKCFVAPETVRPVLSHFVDSGERAEGTWIVLGTD